MAFEFLKTRGIRGLNFVKNKIENGGTIPQKYVYFSIDRLLLYSNFVKKHLNSVEKIVNY